MTKVQTKSQKSVINTDQFTGNNITVNPELYPAEFSLILDTYRVYVALLMRVGKAEALRTIIANIRGKLNQIYTVSENLKSNQKMIKKPFKNPVRSCSIYYWNPEKEITIKNKYSVNDITGQITNKHYYSNLKYCGNMWLCPSCSNRLLKAREQEISLGFNILKQLNNKLYMLTLTIPHNWNSDQIKLYNFLLSSWRKLIQSPDGKAFTNSFPYWVRATEVRHGQNGMHPHFHIIFAKSDQISDSEYKIITAQFCKKWQSITNSNAMEYKGSDLSEFKKDSYIFETNKHLANKELTSSKFTDNSIDSMYLLFIEKNLWNNYALATRNSKRIQQSKQFKSLLDNFIRIKTDDEILHQPNDDLTIYKISNKAWQRLKLNFNTRAEIISLLNNNKHIEFNSILTMQKLKIISDTIMIE